ncbi:endonuclease/exonuclease/phosphatase family protein [Singulisphaera sp. PoT]|uniref:endonuclease/exonuclease/phosphatase family protein n=1 Tax=Singulisphaera sp. PoT TaxID=3411797 RepID=UPI003BF46C9A
MRLISYNIHKGIGGRDRRYSLERILHVIREQEADFVCLQEVDTNVKRSLHHDQPERFCEALGSVAKCYQLNVHLGDGGYGNLVLSRWPFRETLQISLRKGRRKPRGAVLAVVETPEGPFRLVNWHLGLAERERHWQVRQFLEHADFLERQSLPALIVGDFNDWRNTLAHGPFAKHGFKQVTIPHERFRSFPAYFPVISLDKAFSCEGIEIKRAQIVHTKLAKVASDHLPLVVDFHLTATNSPVPEN